MERTIRWTHPNPSDVTGFTVHWGYAPGAYELEMNYEGNVADADGVFSLSLDLEPDRAIYIAVTASRDSETSVLANEQMIYEATPLGVPGRPRLVDEEG